MTKKVLVVEDDPDISKALRIRLQAAGYEVLTAPDSYVGLAQAVQQKPDAMILDISMPAGDGFSIIERLRNQGDMPEIPFIFLTASERPEYREKALALGAHAYFQKPYDAAELLGSLHDAVNGVWNLDV